MESWIGSVGAVSLGKRPLAASSRKQPRLGKPSSVQHIQSPFRQWDGPIGDWNEHFGKGAGQVRSLDGRKPKRSCNEIEMAKQLRSVRDNAFWFSQYNPSAIPRLWRPWVLSLKEAPEWLSAFDARIRQRVTSKRGGMPDVAAWDDEQPLRSALFVECKGPGEPFDAKQEDWVWAARKAGLRLGQIAVSVRPF